MPLIEELPITQSHRISHGWAYVPDTGAPLAALQPGNRKRARDGAAGYATATAKQQKAVQARLDALDRENYKEGVAVPIPQRQGGDRKRDKKMTQNVRRILTYQRAFAHYLADEEANASAGQTTTQQNQTTAAGKADGRRKPSTTTAADTPAATNTNTNTPTATPTPTPARRGRPPNALKAKERAAKMAPPPKPPTPIKQEVGDDKDSDTAMPDAPAIQPPTPAPVSKPAYDPKLDTNPLLRTTGLPKMPSNRVMALLVSEPPLSYVAAKARVRTREGEDERTAAVSVPVRRFCGVCGYWGRVKCRKCGEWTCGILECWKGHEGVCLAQGMF